MPEPKEKAFVGIDPVTMKAMNDDLARLVFLIHNDIPKLREVFARAEVETTPADRLNAIGQWIQAELPMLRRRESYAAQLQLINLQTGNPLKMIHTEWAGNFPSSAAAIARAKELAGKYKDDGKLPGEVWEELSQNQDDPDFAEAFAKALGAEGAGRIAQEFTILAKRGKYGQSEQDQRNVLANLLATASHSPGTIDKTWFEKTSFDGGILDLMDTGMWDSNVLSEAATFVLNARNPDADLAGKTAKIFNGLALYPAVATKVYADNFDQIQKLVRGETTGWTLADAPGRGDALGAFIQSATITSRHLHQKSGPNGPNPAEDLTRRLLLDLHANSKRTEFAGVQGAYTAIAMEYYDDLEAAIAGPPVPSYFEKPDPGRPGIEVPDPAWTTLVQHAMWDPKNAAVLNTFFSAKYTERSAAVTSREVLSARDANSLSNWQNGQIRGWFLAQLNAVKAAHGEEQAAYNAKVKEWVGYVVDPVNAALFATGGPAAAVAAAGRTITGFVKAQGVSAVKDLVISWFDRGPTDYTTDTEWADDHKLWTAKAQELLKSDPPLIRPVTGKDGTTWTGSPQVYEKQYGTKFTDGAGTILPVDTMTPAQQRAYAEWLQDPAVQQAVWNEVGPDILGRVSK